MYLLVEHREQAGALELEQVQRGLVVLEVGARYVHALGLVDLIQFVWVCDRSEVTTEIEQRTT